MEPSKEIIEKPKDSLHNPQTNSANATLHITMRKNSLQGEQNMKDIKSLDYLHQDNEEIKQNKQLFNTELDKQVRTAKETKLNPEHIEIATEAEEQVNIVQNKESVSEDDRIIVIKCLTAFQKALTDSNLQKAERMLNKAKRIDPSLDVEEKLTVVQTAINKKIIEEKRKKDFENAVKECTNAGDCLYWSRKAFDNGNLVNAEQILLWAKTYDRTLNLEPELSKIKLKMAAQSYEETREIPQTDYEQTISKSDIKDAAESKKLSSKKSKKYTIKKAYEAGILRRSVELNLMKANLLDPSLDLREDLSQVTTMFAKNKQGKRNENIKNCENKGDYKTAIGGDEEDKLKIINDFKIKKNERDGQASYEEDKEKQINQAKGEYETTVGGVERDDSKIINDLKKEDDRKKQASNGAHEDEANKSRNKIKLDNVHKYVNDARQFLSNGKLNDAKLALKNAQSICSTPTVESLMEYVEKKIEDSKRLRKSLKINKSDIADAFKCINIAQTAFEENQLEKAERFLVKSLRICQNQTLLETVRNERKKIIPKVTKKDKKNTNEHVNYDFIDEKKINYNKCIDLATHAVVKQDLANAEHFLSKAIRIHPSDEARNELKRIQEITSKTIKSEVVPSKHDSEALHIIFFNFAMDAMEHHNYYVAQFYLQWAMKKQPIETEIEELEQVLQDVQRDIDSRKAYGTYEPECEFKYEASSLLNKVEKAICKGDLKLAETFFIVSWSMHKSQRTTAIHAKFLQARLALYDRDDECNEKKSQQKCDELELNALKKYQKNKYEEADRLLTEALGLHPCPRIEYFLDVIKLLKEGDNRVVQTVMSWIS